MLETWPESVWGKLGKDFALLSGFLHYKTEFYGDAIDELKPLADDPAYVARRPAVLYYLGRAYFANANYGKAVATLERYIAGPAGCRPAPAAGLRRPAAGHPPTIGRRSRRRCPRSCSNPCTIRAMPPRRSRRSSLDRS